MNGADIRAALTLMLQGEMDTPQIVDTLIQIEAEGVGAEPVSYTHLTLPTIYSV